MCADPPLHESERILLADVVGVHDVGRPAPSVQSSDVDAHDGRRAADAVRAVHEYLAAALQLEVAQVECLNTVSHFGDANRLRSSSVAWIGEIYPALPPRGEETYYIFYLVSP